ncbi:hypothetical protein [Actinoplanes sp. NPDC026670]|uniref:hypothetical protein n=1 Tax=Actinoplanes sp. NPDC026670 TaxID=3154700 RepID=UPI0033D1BEC2
MAVIHIRIVTERLNGFPADPELIDTALGREAVLQAWAAAVNGLASAIATVEQKICPPSMFPSRSRRDPRWGKVSAQLGDAATAACRLGDALNEAARWCPKALTDGETVQYSGSQRDVRGRYVLHGYCSCRYGCGDGIELRDGPHGTVLTCVNRSSIDPIPGPWRAERHDVFTAGLILDTEPRRLYAPLTVEHAITVVRGLSAITSRIRAVLVTWQDAFETRLDRRCAVNPHGFHGPNFVRGILADLDRVRPDLTEVRTHLRNAIGVLAEIEAFPDVDRAA